MTPTLRRRLAGWTLAAMLAVAGLLGLLYGLARTVLQREPLVVLNAEVEAGDVGHLLTLVRDHDPRRVPAGALNTVQLTERDLDFLVNHVAYRRLGAPLRITLGPGRAEVQASLHLPTNPYGSWLNVQAVLRETGDLPAFERLQVGGLPLPAWLGPRLLRAAAQGLGLSDELQMGQDLLRQVKLQPARLGLTYVLRTDSAERIVATLVPPAEQLRLKAYSDRLAALAAQVPLASSTSLATWMGPMFELARLRSAAGSDAAAENRAAILVLTLYANGRTLDSVLPAARLWQRPRPVHFTLSGRDDSPLHLLISAALVVEGTSPLSKAVGLYKEVADSRGGSGFSFNDLAADRAGTRLGELALQQPQRLQALLARGVSEADFMPLAADLPESMPEPEFKRRFGGVGQPRYVAMMAEIDRRISALPALR